MKEILILFGGNSNEHSVSIKSAESIAKHIDQNLFKVSYVYISKDNLWYKFHDDFAQLSNKQWCQNHEDDIIFNVIKYLQYFDVVFPILHGKNGEDGRLQGMLELFQIPYVGCSAVASGIAMNKSYTKMLATQIKIPTLPFVVIDKDDYMVEEVSNVLDFPVIVKPMTEGSSIGIEVVNTISDLDQAIKKAGVYAKQLLVEPFIQGKELECAILYNNGAITGAVGEIKTIDHFYDYETKYQNDNAELIIPATISEDHTTKIQTYSKQLFKLLGNQGFARIDFFLEKESQQIYLNEINTIPGFTSISMFPKLFEYSGLDYQNLITTLIENAID